MDTVNIFNNIIATDGWSIITENKKYIDLTLGLSCFTWGYNNKQLLQALGLVAIQKGNNSFFMIAPQNASHMYWDDVESKFSMFT